MTSYRVSEHASVAALRDALAPPPSDDAADDLFQTLAWFENLERHGIDGAARVRVLTARPDGDASAAICLPLWRQPRGPAAAYGPVLSGLSNYYSSLYGTMGRAAHCTPAACRALLQHLRRAGPGAGVIDLQPLDRDGAFLASMSEALRDQGYWVDTYFCFGNWHQPIGGRPFDVYFETVPSRIRNTIRRGRKKLDDVPDASVRILTGAEGDFEQAIADFDAVYRRSWKVPEPFPEFVPNLIRTAAREGWLRLGVVRLGTVPIASQLWLVRDGHALIYKLAYDEEHKRYSAGSVLTAALMRHVIDVDRVVDVDYLTGDDAYKADWMSERRERVGLVAFDPRTLQGLVSAARHFLGKWWRQRRPSPTSAPAPAATEAAVPLADGLPEKAQ